MLKSIVIGQYLPRRSPVHDLDARVKILALLGYVLALFLAASWPQQALLAAFAIGCVALARLPAGAVLRGLRPVLWLLVVTVGLNAVTSPPPFAYRWLGFITVSRQGLDFGLQMGVRLVLLYLASSLLTLCTAPVDLTDGLEAILGPLQRIGVPAHDIAMMMTIALRFIPTLLAETERIMQAQRARGADFDRGGPVRRVRALVPLLVPLFVSAFRRADELAVAMEARAYRGGKGRTHFRVHRLRLADGVAAGATLALVAVLAVLRWRP